MKRIVVATNNKGKMKEIAKILQGYELLTLKDINCDIEVEEDGKTFEENSMKKASEIFKITNIPCIADDSGICINALNGWPGVYTARFLGEDATQEERNLKMIEELNLKNTENRNAKVVCVIAYVDKEQSFFVEGIVNGKIVKEPRGENGFGFDEIFELENGKTLAELSEEEKNQVSSRKIALEKLKKLL